MFVFPELFFCREKTMFNQDWIWSICHSQCYSTLHSIFRLFSVQSLSLLCCLYIPNSQDLRLPRFPTLLISNRACERSVSGRFSAHRSSLLLWHPLSAPLPLPLRSRSPDFPPAPLTLVPLQSHALNILFICIVGLSIIVERKRNNIT